MEDLDACPELECLREATATRIPVAELRRACCVIKLLQTCCCQ